MGLLVPPLLVILQLTRSGMSTERRGVLRTLVEINASPGYRRQSLNEFIAWSLTTLDENTLIRGTSARVRDLIGEQMMNATHPTLATVGTCVRIVFPDSAKDPDSPVSSE